MSEYVNITDIPDVPEIAIVNEIFSYMLYGHHDETKRDELPPGIDPTWFEDMRIQYSVANTYDVPSGKFQASYGSAAIIDCHYLLENMIGAVKAMLEEHKSQIFFVEYELIMERINEVQDYITTYQVNACTYSYLMKGVLND